MLGCSALMLVACLCAQAEPQPATPAPRPAEKATPPASSPPPVDARPAATVDGAAISLAEVNREVQRVLPGESPAAATLALVQAQALAQLIDRRLILRNLSRTQVAAEPREVDVMMERLVKQLEPRKITLAEHLQRLGVDEAGLRHQIAWQISWGRYLERYLSDENLERYFKQHAREFDGTQIRVAHILLKPDPAGGAAAFTEIFRRAEELRAALISGQTTFVAAAQAHSAAPTGKQGGDIGFIGRREPMPESFSRAAFALEPDQISPPVASVFGVHLIRCLEIKAGQGTWQQARGELETAVTQYLFRWLADKERPAAKIEFSGWCPHFRPGTDQLVPARSTSDP
ncbi:MAG: peptidylprolyl isomerase [Pirellulales bacterium]